MVEIILALLIQLLTPTSEGTTANQKNTTAAASTQSISTQSISTQSTTPTAYDGGQVNWDTRD